jgi:hypothetical protein
MARLIRYDEQDNKYEWHELDAEVIEAYGRVVDGMEEGEAKEQGKFLLAKFENEGIGICKSCGEPTNKGWEELTEDGKATGAAICMEHALDGTEFELYIRKSAVRKEAKAKAKAKAEERERFIKEQEAKGLEMCDRCGGYGIIQAYQHVNGGTCFKCGGAGFFARM